MSTLISKTLRHTLPPCLALCLGLITNAASAKDAVVAKWGRFDQSFRSGVNYENPFQQCALKVTVVSPAGATNVIDGFWDGGKTWRVRFSPDELGTWTYHTSCSDPANRGLDNQSGKFVCTSITGQGRFAKHGPIRVAKDHHHFEHADGTPFFWLADVAWNAPRLSNSRDWITYTQTRGGQNFSVVQWSAGSGVDAKNRSAFTGNDRVTIDPAYFQALDEKVDLMNRAGLLSVIAPLWGNTNTTKDLPAEQLALLVRYMNARWGAYDVAWLLTIPDANNARWMNVARSVFNGRPHAPVILFSGELRERFAEFRDESWVDAFGYGLGQTVNSESVQWLLSEPLRREFTRPLINVLPPLENGLEAKGEARISDDDVRRVAWWSALLTPSAGVSYGAQDVATWNTTKQSKLPVWQLSLFLPGAKQMSHLEQGMESIDWRTLHPASRSLANQPGGTDPYRYVAHADSDAKNLSLTYVPADRTVELTLEALPSTPVIQWLNPRTGKMSPAVAVVGSSTCQFPTPDKGDWVLVAKSGK